MPRLTSTRRATRPPLPLPPPDPINAPPAPQAETFFWDGIKGSETVIMLKNCYEKNSLLETKLVSSPKRFVRKELLTGNNKAAQFMGREIPTPSVCHDSNLHYALLIMLIKLFYCRNPPNLLKAKTTLWLWKKTRTLEKRDFLQLLREAEALQQRLPKEISKRDRISWISWQNVERKRIK